MDNEPVNRKTKISVPLEIKNHEFIRREFNFDIAESIDDLKVMPPVTYERIFDRNMNVAIHKLRTHIYVDRYEKTRKIKHEYPANWWQHLKQGFLFKYPKLSKIFGIDKSKIKCKAKVWNIKFTKDYFPTLPEWHKDIYYENKGGSRAKLQIASHERTSINGD
jgi:hypothetical protein